MITWEVNTIFLGNHLGQWLDAALILAGGWLAGKLVSWSGSTIFGKLASRTPGRLDDELVQTTRRPLVTLVTVISFMLGYNQLDVPGQVDRWMERASHVAVAMAVTWAVVRVLDLLVGAFLRDRHERSEDAGNAQFIPVVRSAVKALVWGLGVVVALNNAGYDVGALLAGIGIGGLAMAMAAKDTLANIFGGITVFTDKPFRVGDRVRLNGYDGLVEEVGLRSTRIRTLEGPIVVVPNNKFTDSLVENVSEEPSRRIRHEIGLACTTTTAQMEQAIDILHALVNDHGADLEAEHVAYFSTIKESSLNIVFIYHIRNGSPPFDVQTRVNLDLLDRFRKAGFNFAVPTSVQYTAELPR